MLVAIALGQLERFVGQRLFLSRVMHHAVRVGRIPQVSVKRTFGKEGDVWAVIALAEARVTEQAYGGVLFQQRCETLAER